MKCVLKKLHPENLIDLLIDSIIWMMEAWAVLRALIIMILVVITIVMNLNRLLPSYDNLKRMIGKEYENSCVCVWVYCND